MESLPPDQLSDLARQVTEGELRAGPFHEFAELTNPLIDLPDLPDPPTSPCRLVVRVELEESDPLIWRRLAVRGDLGLDEFHHVLQAAMGWLDMHLHRFSLGGAFTEDAPWFVTQEDVDEGEEGTSEGDARLDQILTEPGDTLHYEYDFGDGWSHGIRLEEVTELEEERVPARCLAGERQGALEDSGGVHGYNVLAEWARSGFAAGLVPEGYEDDEEEQRNLREWLPPMFDPDDFSLGEVNEQLTRVAAGDVHGITGGLDLTDELVRLVGEVAPTGQFEVMAWLGAPAWLEPVLVDVRDAESMVRPWRVLLDAVGDDLALTGAGYLPPATVQAIFDALGMAEIWIGKGNREDLTPPVAELRRQAQAWGLLRKNKGRLLSTRLARAFAGDPVALWWHVVGQLPSGTDAIERQAGNLVLLAIGGGVSPGRELETAVQRQLTGLGWRMESGEPVDGFAVRRAMRPTLTVIEQLAGVWQSRTEPDERLVSAIAVAAARPRQSF